MAFDAPDEWPPLSRMSASGTSRRYAAHCPSEIPAFEHETGISKVIQPNLEAMFARFG
jgi:hypothetical protein